MSEQNKAIVRRLVEDGFNKGNLQILEELSAPDFINHNAPPGFPPTREGWRQATAMFRAAFPDVHVHIEDEIAEGDRVTGRFTAHGTHQGELMGIPATGKEVNVTGIYILRLADGKIVERWEEADMMGLMQQLGVVPAPAG